MSAYEGAVSCISQDVKDILKLIDDEIKKKCSEIRLRAEKPVSLVCEGKLLNVSIDGSCYGENSEKLICSKAIIEDTFSRMCNFSVHAYQADIINGSLLLKVATESELPVRQ